MTSFLTPFRIGDRAGFAQIGDSRSTAEAAFVRRWGAACGSPGSISVAGESAAARAERIIGGAWLGLTGKTIDNQPAAANLAAGDRSSIDKSSIFTTQSGITRVSGADVAIIARGRCTSGAGSRLAGFGAVANGIVSARGVVSFSLCRAGDGTRGAAALPSAAA